MIEPYYSDGMATIYQGDCLELLPAVCAVDAIIADPPYGIGFKYAEHDDTREGYRDWCGKVLDALLRRCVGPVMISCGINNLCNWRQPDWVLCWHKPAAMGRSRVGYNNWEPVLFYGKHATKKTVDVFKACIVPDKSVAGRHPCPKPIGWASELVSKFTREGSLVLDPFMGSGTTGVACIKHGRRFVGIEKTAEYCDLAIERILAAKSEFSLLEAVE